MNTSHLPRVALIAGPTASGKSALANAVAQRFPATIINADSMQVYADLRIVTARPQADDELAVPHRLYGEIDGATAYSAAAWARAAKAAVDEAHRVGRLPILVGGTGLYIRTLLEGIAPVPEIEGSVRAEVRALTVGDAYQQLLELDPAAAARLSVNDTARVARALEVVRSTGLPLAHWQSRRAGGIGTSVTLAPMLLMPQREWLFRRCERRFEMILDAGQDEVAALLSRKLDPALPVMRAIGVAEIGAFIGGTVSRNVAIQRGTTATRQYAKRQYTWFGRQTPASWNRVTEDSIKDQNAVIKLLTKRLT